MVPNLKRRFIAFFVDYILIYLFVIVLFLKLKWSLHDLLTLMIGAAFFSLLYFTFFWCKFHGQTPGSFLLRIRLISQENRPIKFTKALLRAGLLFPFFCPRGAIALVLLSSILISIKLLNTTPYRDKKQLFWDLVSNTYVVISKRNK